LKWLELSTQADADSAELVCEVFHRFGCGGVIIDGDITLTPEGELFANFERSITVRAYLPLDDSAESKRQQIDDALGRLSFYGTPELKGKVIDEKDWTEEFKRHFKVFTIGEHIAIKPSWEEYTPKNEEMVIELDPGLAFGTGLHASTRMCLVQIERLLRPGMAVLDLGTGSGILTIAAVKLGAAQVVALDVDPVAIKVARENMAANGIADPVVLGQGTLPEASAPSELWGRFDLVLANILARVISNLAESLVRALKPGGILICGGILLPHLEEVNSRLREAGATILDVIADEEWQTVVAQAL